MEESPRATEVLTSTLQADSELVALRAARSLQLLGKDAVPARNKMAAVRDSLQRIRKKTGHWSSPTAWYIYESLDAALHEMHD
jgi:hypothetical protein